MGSFWFRGSGRGPARKKTVRQNKRSFRPLLEALEERLAPAVNDFYIVPGAPGEQVPVLFQWNEQTAVFQNSLIIYEVNDTSGGIQAFNPATGSFGVTAPTDPGYARLVATLPSVDPQAEFHAVFQSGDGPGSARTILLPAGTILGFALIVNAPLQTWQARMSQAGQENTYGGSVAWLSFNGSNPEAFDAVFSRELSPGVQRFWFEDQGFGNGNPNYRDMVFTVSPSGDRALAVPGLAGQVTPATFELLGRFADFRNELGLFFVDNSHGQIGSLFPGDDGYMAQALAAGNRQTVFSPHDPVGTMRTVNMPGGGFFALYVVANGSTAELLAANPGNIPGTGGPQAFFYFPEMNFDRLPHFRPLGNGVFGVEDQLGGGDNDFNDLIFRLSFTAPIGDVIAPVITARLLNDTGDSDSDNITNDPTVTGTITDASAIAEFEASVNNSAFASVLDAFDTTTGTFLLDRNRLEAILGGPLDDGPVTVQLRARDAVGNQSQIFTLTFTLDTQAPAAPTVNLTAATDSGEQGDLTTFFEEVSLTGTTQANATVRLLGPNNLDLTITANAQGQFTFDNVPLDLGDNDFTLEVTDQAGNQAAPLDFTVVRVPNSDPVFTGTISDFNMLEGDAVQALDLALFFSDEDIGTSQYRFEVLFGDQAEVFEVQLFDRETPATVANFLNYLEGGRYDDTIFHRSVTNFVLQGGGYAFVDGNPAMFVDLPTDPAVVNEPGISNLRGTMAMAKLDGQPNSATNEFFINLANNSANLDFQNGGFTVFGEVVVGMNIIDQIAAQPTQDRSSPFDDLPVFGPLPAGDIVENPPGSGQYPLPAGAQASNFALIDNITEVFITDRLTYSIEIISGDADFVDAVLSIDHRLTINPVETGSATIRIIATDVHGATVASNEFTITIT